MSASAAEVHFAAEFVTFLAAAVGIAVVLLRGDLLTAGPTRTAMAGGFVLVGAAAFFHGSLVLGDDSDRPALFALRLAGVIGLAVGAARWAGPPRGARLMWLGLALLTVAAALGMTDAAVPTSALLAAGSLMIGGAVVYASRRSIASRVAASASITLLLVVLVLAVGISAVLTNTVQDQARDRLRIRAASEAKFVSDPAKVRILEAGIVGGSLAQADRVPILRSATTPASAKVIANDLDSLSRTFLEDRPLAYIDAASGQVVAQTRTFPGSAVALRGSGPVVEALTKRHRVGSVLQSDGKLLAVGVAPVGASIDGVARTVGAVVSVSEVDDGYVEARISGEADLGAAVATRAGYVGRFGDPPAFADVQSLVDAVLADTSKPTTSERAERFVAVAPVLASDEAGQRHGVAAVLVWQPTTVVADTREELYRILFVIALGGTLLALALAALVGNRIGSGLRLLTDAAGAIQGGDLAARVAIDADDEVGVLGSAFDSMAVSIQEKTTELATARNRLEAVVAGMGEALIATDADGRVTDFNRSAEELLGVSAAEVRGMPADEVLALRADDGSPVADRLRKPSPRRWSIEGTLASAEDEAIPVALTAGALRGLDDELAGAVYVVRDLRREREVERMKTEFLSRMGHELRTPLTGITGYAELLTRKQVPPERARQWHEEILKQSRALLRIVQMLEFFASTGAGRVYLRPERVNLRQVIDDVVDRRKASANGHKLTRRVARGVPKIVADERWLTQSIEELVDNAVKFSPDGGRISITASVADDGRVEIAVADKGVGMTRDEQDFAFAEFVQGDTSDTRRFGGLGLGLSLVQRVAEAHGGAVTCQSAPGKGSKFSIFLPVLPMEEGR
jgi:PAS domain S-box-containing protein